MLIKEKLLVSHRKEMIEDQALISEALNGSKHALESLIYRYKNWIFNIAIRMVIVPEDAEDVTQEILIKIITRLQDYDQARASFKTWLYRIVVNHVINMKKKGLENSPFNFANYYERMNFIEDRTPADTPEIKALIYDTMLNCVMATLICLNRTQRLVIVLGVIFNIDSQSGGELLGITGANFRKILSRSRHKLKGFMSRTCSLVNNKAGCRCHLKITELVRQGYRDPDKLIYQDMKYTHFVKDVIGGKVKKFMNNYFNKFNNLFQSQPFWEAPAMTGWLDEAIKSKEFKDIFNLDGPAGINCCP